jgi:NAD(P)H-dependent FMN reductase
MSPRALLLVGSPRASRSTSAALGSYLLDRLGEEGFDVQKSFAYPSLASDRGFAGLLLAVREADLVVIAFPVYADSLPSGLIRAMEVIEEDGKRRVATKRQRILALSNSGFPEASHSALALAMCKLFAREAGFEWAGGLALGGGESIGGRPLERAGGLVRNVRKSIELAALALARGEAVPAEAVELMAKPLMARWFYLLMGNIGWRLRARREGCKGNLKSRPYQE